MKIWLLSSELPHELVGGIARYIYNYAIALHAAGHEVTVIARTDHPLSNDAIPGVRVFGVCPRYALLSETSPDISPDCHPAFPYNLMAYAPALSYQLAETVLQLAREESPPDV